jgi:hypothetical protein
VTQNITQIPAPRVPLIDERTGYVSREWFRFFNNQFLLTGNGTTSVSIADLELSSAQAAAVEAEVAVLRTKIQDLEIAPLPTPAATTSSSGPVPVITNPPVTKTADFTVGANETWIINNKSGSTCTVTLPSASSNSGLVLYFQNYQSQQLVSASSNVVPQGGGSAGTAILAATAGDWATLVSDGTNWVIMQAAKYNNLLLE